MTGDDASRDESALSGDAPSSNGGPADESDAPAPDPTYLLPFAGAFLVSTVLALTAARLSSDEFDLSRLSWEIRRLDEPMADGGSGRVGDGRGESETADAEEVRD
jgi:hypothetical protein